MFKKIFRKIKKLIRLKSSIFWNWFNDKYWIKKIIKEEQLETKQNMRTLSNMFSLWNHLLNSYINFQYVTEFFTRFRKELGINESDILYLDSGFKDLGVSIRLATLWYYKSSYFHLRRFIEAYIAIVWNSLYKNIDKKRIWDKMEYLNGINNQVDKIYFRASELYKIYDYLSTTQVHGHKDKNINVINFKSFVSIWSMTFLIVNNMLYTFFQDKIEKHRTKDIENPVKWERNYYRYIFWYLFTCDAYIFDSIELDPDLKRFYRAEVKLDPRGVIWNHYKERVKNLGDINQYMRQVEKFDKRIRVIIKDLWEKYRYLENKIYIDESSFDELEKFYEKEKISNRFVT